MIWLILVLIYLASFAAHILLIYLTGKRHIYTVGDIIDEIEFFMWFPYINTIALITLCVAFIIVKTANLSKLLKDNGYRWNAETKNLEKLIKPKFKVGDRIKSIISSSYYTVVDIKNDQYFIKSDTEKYPYQVHFSNEINYELVPNKFDVNTLVPFESRVLVRDGANEPWEPAFFGYYKDGKSPTYSIVGGSYWEYCIPYEGNEHLLGKTDDCEEYYKTWED